MEGFGDADDGRGPDDWQEVWADLAPFVPDAGEMFPDAVEVMVVDTLAVGDSVAHVAISPDGTKALAIKPVVNKVCRAAH